MISVLPVQSREKLERLFSAAGLCANENSGAVTAVSGEEQLGCCLFDLFEMGILIRHISPADEPGLADGVLRSALHIAAQRCAMDAHYADTVPEELLKKLGFIADIAEKRLDIDKLFGGCGCGR